jgi:hypothetical protein
MCVPDRYTTLWIALGAGRPLEAHLSRTMIVQQSAEDEFG